MIFLVLSTLFACNSLNHRADMSDGEVDAISAIDDLDGNGVVDFGNQSFAFGQTEIGASIAFFFSATLPVNATGQSYSEFGYGSEEYSNSEFGWETPFLLLPEMTDSNDNVVGYGATGLRDGLYETACGLTDATPYTQNGYCKVMEGLTENDNQQYLAVIVNGGPDCAGMSGYDSGGYKTDTNLAFIVENGVVSPLGGSFAPPDTNCHVQ